MLDQTALPQAVHRDPSVSPPASNAPLASAAPEWPEPDCCLLDDSRGHLPVFPVDVLPKAWRPWAPRAARGANASVDHVALSLLTVAASQIGHARYVAPAPSWLEPCILWTALVGAPSSGKTPAMDMALRPIREMQRRLILAHHDAVGRHEQKYRQDRARVQEHLRSLESGKGPLLDDLPEIEPRPEPPRPATASDGSIEALAEMLNECERGMLVARDERSGWLERMRGDSESAFWLSAWSAHAFLLESKGKATQYLRNPAISIMGTLEPDTMTAALAAGDDRVLARFLFGWAERPPVQSLSEAMMDAFTPEERAALPRLYDMPDAPRAIGLDAEALSVFDGFRRLHDTEFGKLEGRQAAWWGKGPGNVLRLAGTLTYLAWAIQPAGTPEPAQIPAWTVKAAARLWQSYLWPHARAVFRLAGNAEGDKESQTVLRWVRQQGRTEVSRTELRRYALGGHTTAATAERIAESLVTAGWLKAIEPANQGRGRRPVRWAVNPALQAKASA